MSHKGGRKSHTTTLAEEKDKRSTDTPVKEMKKKIAANAEKEKQVSDKTVTLPEKSDNTEKVPEKPQTEKNDSKKGHTAEKVDKNLSTPDKNAQKADKLAEKTVKPAEKEKVAEKEKIVEKSDKKIEKVADKKVDKPAEKKVDKPAEKKNESEKKEEGKTDGKDKPEKPKQNGGVGDANGSADTVSDSDSSEEELLVIDDQDEAFPELTYDETSDADFEEGAPSRSFTRRSQVKATKTPETPRPASVKEDESKEKVLKLNDTLTTDRKLRSADSPKPESKKPTEQKKTDSPRKDAVIDLTDDPLKERNGQGVNDKEANERSEGGKASAGGKNKLEMDVVIEVESIDEARSKTRARVSPFTSRLPTAKHDQTTSSVTANYTGNNTTMEMDITETSSILEEANLDDSAYLRGLRAIRGRTSYKPLTELALKHTLNRSNRSTASSTNVSLLETGRPTGTVVGRKRKPDAGEVEPASEAAELDTSALPPPELLYAHNKRARLFDRFSVPFRGFNVRTADIVGINTDLPLTAPVASTSAFDPETLKPSPSDAPRAAANDRDGKRCLIM